MSTGLGRAVVELGHREEVMSDAGHQYMGVMRLECGWWNACVWWWAGCRRGSSWFRRWAVTNSWFRRRQQVG